MTSVDVLADQVGCVFQFGSNSVLGSCFLVSDNMVVTCYHVLNFDSRINTDYCVKWPRLNIEVKATIIKEMLSSTDDVAFLSLDTSISFATQIVPLGIKHTFDADFSSFGYRKNNCYCGLFTTGSIRGEIDAADGKKLLQLCSSEIDKGMSGAPVFELSYGCIVGMISGFWLTSTNIDTSLAFAIPISRLIALNPGILLIIPEVNAVPKFIDTGLSRNTTCQSSCCPSISEDELVFACTRAALMVFADQFEDGAWGRNLWKETNISITTDVADKGQVSRTHIKKALSATSWAAQALVKATGTIDLSVTKAVDFAQQHQERTTGAFGNLYASGSATPLVYQTTFIRSPRHTASGIKLVELANGLTRDVISGCEFILNNQCLPNGGWGEAIGDSPNILATAYVLDALIKLLQIQNFQSLLASTLANEIKPAINRGLAWLISQRDSDNLWQYSGNDEYKFLYSAFVLGVVPQLSDSYYDETVESLNSLLKHSVNGGVPSLRSNPADLLTTSLCLYSMLRVDPMLFDARIQESVKWIVEKVNSDYWNEDYRSMHGIFTLVALAQLPNIPRNKFSNQLTQMLTDISNFNAGSLSTIELWLKINNQFNLNLKKAIEEMFK